MVLTKRKIVLVCDSNDNSLLYFIYDKIKKEEGKQMLANIGWMKISCPHLYIVFELINTKLQPEFVSTAFFSEKSNDSCLEKREV